MFSNVLMSSHYFELCIMLLEFSSFFMFILCSLSFFAPIIVEKGFLPYFVIAISFKQGGWGVINKRRVEFFQKYSKISKLAK